MLKGFARELEPYGIRIQVDFAKFYGCLTFYEDMQNHELPITFFGSGGFLLSTNTTKRGPIILSKHDDWKWWKNEKFCQNQSTPWWDK